MGLFNFFRKSEQSTTSSESAPTTPWDDLKNEHFRGDQAAETPAEKIKREGDQLIAMYMHSDASVLKQKDVSVTPAETAAFYEDINSGRLDTAAQSILLQQVPTSLWVDGRDNYQGVFSRIKDKHGMKILALAAGAPIEQIARTAAASTMTGQHIQQFNTLLQQCPTPIELNQRQEEFMNRLERNGNPPLKLAEYEEAFEHFKEAVYGERYDYFQALDVLKHNAIKASLERSDAAEHDRRAAELQRMQGYAVILPDPDSPYTAPELRAAADDQPEAKR